MSNLKYILLMAGFLALAGCTSPTVPDPEMSDTTTGSDGADTEGTGGTDYGNGTDVLDDSSAGELANIIYFDFDSSEVRSADTDTVAGHASMMSGKMNINVRLEGHADERGSREYNIGLGERRAQAVRRLLLLQGVSAGQISTVSFGEERPAADGSGESAYAQNRRVEIIYTN
jgi:peptidoglycan-associated lipoprotein